MKITKLTLHSFCLDFRVPLNIGDVTPIKRRGYLFRVVTNTDHVGFGEMAPLPGYSDESLDDSFEQISDLEDLLTSRLLPDHLDELSGEFENVLGHLDLPGSARFAVESALLNAQADAAGVSLAELLGECPQKAVPVNALLEESETALDRATRLAEEGWSCFKLKIGRDSLENEVALIRKLAESLPDVRIRLDANQGLNQDAFDTLCAGIPTEIIDYLEEPLESAEANLALAAGATAMPIALDESLRRLEPEEIHKCTGLAAVVLKPTILGLERSVRFARAAQSRSITPVISSTFESSFGLSILAQVAAAIIPTGVHAGLDTSEVFASDICEPLTPRRGVIAIDDAVQRVREFPSPLFDRPFKVLPPVSPKAALRNKAIALSFEGDTWNFRQLNEDIIRTMAALAKVGGQSGKRLALAGQTNADTIITILAACRRAMVVCLLNTRWTSEQTAAVIATADMLPVDLNDIKKYSVESPPFGLRLLRGSSPFMAVTIVHTAGSTGSPKGVIHTWGNHLSSAVGSNRNIVLGYGDRWLLNLPIYHVGGLSILFRCWAAGAEVALPNRDESLVDAIRRLQPTHISLVPTQLYRLLRSELRDRDLRCLKAVLIGGAAANPTLVREAHSLGLPLFMSYGSTEMASQITTTRPGADLEELLTSGRPLEGREVTIDDSGEILVRGETLAKHYLIDGTKQPVASDDGWFHSGDLGKWDAQGNLIVFGRRDRMFVSGGENIHPEAIELALRDLDGVAEAAVLAVSDEEFGHRPVAIIQSGEGEKLSADLLGGKLRERLPGYMIPKAFYCWPSGHPASMKPDLSLLEKVFESGDLEPIT